ncbi:NUDIX domain-containing protein [Phormidium tenue FACHB-886]|nr:NUDIX domain-containing protein [Phormidium tenue FACHB-886]
MHELGKSYKKLKNELAEAFSKPKNSFSKKLKSAAVRKRLRGTALIETPQGILLVSSNGDRFSLPGGGAEKQESGEQAAIRELKEETGLEALSTQYLFKHVGGLRMRSSGLARNHHQVFLVETKGVPCPNQEIKAIHFYQPGDDINITNSARAIIEKYLKMKKEV